MNFRWYLFWLKDLMNGFQIRKAYNNLKSVYNYEGNRNNLTEKQLSKLLQYAKSNTRFYSKITSNSIKDFPIINKMDLREKQDEFLVNENLVVHKMSTSGSTGTPLVIKQDKIKRNRVLAEVLFFGKIAEYTFGEKQVFFRIWNEKNKKSKIQKFLQNMVTEDISNLNDDTLKRIVEVLKEEKVKNILSYASTLDVISKYMLEHNEEQNKYSVKSIFSSSELLQEETRKILKKIFKCNVYSRYSNQENGILAQEISSNEYYRLNEADYYIEFLKIDSDEEANKGEISRIVVTDLYNYATPIIRYDTGDLAIYDEDKYGNKIIKELYGRREDLIYNTRGRVVSPHAF